MSDTTDDTNQEDASEKKNWRRELEERAAKAEEEAKALKEEKATRERSDAFKDAGLDLAGNKLHALAAKAYEGDITPDAIKAFALDAGLIAQDNSAQLIANQHANMDLISQNAEPPSAVGSQAEAIQKLEQASKSKDKNAFYAVLAQQGMLKQG